MAVATSSQVSVVEANIALSKLFKELEDVKDELQIGSRERYIDRSLAEYKRLIDIIERLDNVCATGGDDRNYCSDINVNLVELGRMRSELKVALELIQNSDEQAEVSLMKLFIAPLFVAGFAVLAKPPLSKVVEHLVPALADSLDGSGSPQG
jgi:hypothetical protein